MYDDKQYDRAFLMLLPESGGYALEGQKLTGSAIVELRNGKGKITANINGLKPITNAIYKMYFISSTENGTLGIECGAIEPDSKGKSVKIWDFDPNNVCGCGLTYGDFNIIAVLAKSMSQSQNEIIAPLVGYKDNVVIWKSGFKEFDTDKKDTKHQMLDTSIEAVKEKPDEAGQKIKDKIEEIAEKAGDEAAQLLGKVNDIKDEVVEVKEAAHSALAHKLRNVLSTQRSEDVNCLLKRLESSVPSDIYNPLMSITNKIFDHIPEKLHSQAVSLTEELIAFVPGEDYDPLMELLKLVDEHVPPEVVRTFAEQLEKTTPHLTTESSSIGSKNEPVSAESFANANYAQTADIAGRIVNHYIPLTPKSADKSSAVTEGNNLSHYSLNDIESNILPASASRPNSYTDHDVEFREKLRNFADRFDGIEQYKPDFHIAESVGGQYLSEEEEKSIAEEERIAGMEMLDDFDEQGLFKIFDERPAMYPFPQKGNASINEKYMPYGPYKPINPGRHEYPPKKSYPPINEIRWIRITDDDVNLLPKRIWRYRTNPFVESAYRKYRHFILGVSRKGHGRSFFFGVPGIYNLKNKVIAERLGFSLFLPIDGGWPREGEFGYWIGGRE